MSQSRLTINITGWTGWTGCIGLVLAAGCAAPAPTTLPDAVSAYRNGRYQDGYAAATGAMRRTDGSQRHAASYVAGLCSYRMGDRTEAELRFLMAAGSSDSATAGAARAMVGVMLLEREEHGEAAEMLERAARDLNGEDRIKAAEFAAAARRGEGTAPVPRTAAAPVAGSAAGSRAGGAPAHATHRAGVKGFTLQAGAFREPDHARSVAVDLEPVAARLQLGQVRVIRAFDGEGAGLYLVQLGEFSTRQDAATMRQRLGTEYIVAPMSRSRGAGG